MNKRKGGMVLKLFFLTLGLTMLAGCAMMDFPKKLEFSSDWVSTKEGKSKEQLQEDQAQCRRDIMVSSPPAFSGQGGMGGGGGWDMNDMKAFENCMRAKGWVKQ